MPLVHTEEIIRLMQVMDRSRRPVWVQAFAVAAGAVAVPGLGHVPVPVAVGSVAVLAESCVVVEPGGVDLGEAQGRPECLGDPSGPAVVDGAP